MNGILSDNQTEAADATRVKADPSFKIVALRIGSDGGFSGQVVKDLNAKIYNRIVATKLVAYEARQRAGDGLLVLVDPAGKVISVLQDGSGKPPRLTIAMRAKRAVKELMPPAPRRRRTSRPASKGAAKKRRTSRR